jgi:PQQ-like domain
VTAVIDLGEGHGAVEAEVVPPPRKIRLDRRITAPLVILITLFVLAGAARLPPPLVSELAVVHASSQATMLLDGDHLYIADIGSGATLSAYRLPRFGSSDSPQWTTPLDVGGTQIDTTLRSGVILAQAFDDRPDTAHLDAIDERTGRKLWQSAANSTLFLSEQTLLLEERDGRTFRMVDLFTGRPYWALDVPYDCAIQVNDSAATGKPATRMVEVCENDSRAHVIDLANGRQLVSGPVSLGDPRAPVPSDWSGRSMVALVGGVIVIAHVDLPLPVLEAYSVSDLRPLWNGRRVQTVDAIYGCDGYVCVDSQGRELVIDTRTGKTAPPLADQPPTQNLSSTPPGPRLVMVLYRGGHDFNPDGAVVDIPVAGPSYTLAYSMQVPTYGGSFDGVWAAVQSADGRLTPLRAMHGIRPEGCSMFPAILVCATESDEITLWRLPAGLGS